MCRSPFLLVWFSILAAGSPSSLAEPGPTAPPQAVQAYAFDLVNVGEFDRAREMFARLAAMEGEPLARTAWFHWGNLLELHAMMDARSIQEARGVLEQAREAHARTVAGLEAAPAGDVTSRLRDRVAASLAGVEENLRVLDAIEEGELELIEAAETLDDMNTPAAADTLLRAELNEAEPGADQYFFLSLVYRLSYVDHLYLRLANMWQAAAGPNADLLSEGARARELDKLDAATREGETLLESAYQAFGKSPHWLDFLSLAADNHRYQGLMHLMRADLLREGKDAAAFAGDDPGASSEAAALAHFEQMVGKTREIIDFADKALEDPSLLSGRQREAYSDAQLQRYGAMARETLAEVTRLAEGAQLPLEAFDSHAEPMD